MRSVGLFEAKQKLSELVDAASRGQEIGITKRGKLVAKISAATPPKKTWREIFDELDEFHRQIKMPHLTDEQIKELIEEGRE